VISREYVSSAIARRPAPGNAFWVGHPSDDAKKLYFGRAGIKGREMTGEESKNAEASVLQAKSAGQEEIDFNLAIGSDMIWISPELDMRCWRHPEGRPMWDCFRGKRVSLGEGGVFAECEDVREVEAFDWPDPKYLNLETVIADTRYAHEKGLAVFGGMWCPFFHVMADFFGMENYFCKMYTHPEVVHAATERIVNFYVEANRIVLKETGSYLEAGFFGNDFGTQLNLMISPECFDEFILPYMKRIVRTIREAGLKVAMHSCGSIERVIPRLIDAGVDILHPLQARAKGMDANSLARYKRDLVFMGGVDTQQLLPFGTAREVYDEVMRLRDIFGEGFIVSPSHEALLPNVPYENVLAMAEAAKA
jgi:uroporphyrinogen decarboxylase